MASSSGAGVKNPRPKLVLRRRRLSKKQVKKLQNSKKIQTAWRLALGSFVTLKQHIKVLGGITLVYGLASVLLVQSSTNLTTLESEEPLSAFERASSDFGNLIGSFGASDSLMQFILLLLFGLALIWALRRLYAGESASTKLAYYQAMTPTIPVILLFVLLFIQLIPMLLASAGLQFAANSGLSASPLEVIAWFIVFILATIWSFFMITRTYVAIFIVTLPGMMPTVARKKARELVIGRRLSISLKLVFLPLFLLFALGIVLIPVIMFLPGLASPLFVVLNPLATCLGIIYLFNLYQEIIK